MINVDVVSDSDLWNKKIVKKDYFFNTLVSFFPRKYRFIKKKVKLTILLSNNVKIKKLNKKFRNNNNSTDVLSFPFEKNPKIKNFSYLGDIVISYEFMNKPKNLNNFEFKDKVIKIFIHGFLHLLGYDHTKIKDFKKMIREEKKIFKAVKTKIAKIA